MTNEFDESYHMEQLILDQLWDQCFSCEEELNHINEKKKEINNVKTFRQDSEQYREQIKDW